MGIAAMGNKLFFKADPVEQHPRRKVWKWATTFVKGHNYMRNQEAKQELRKDMKKIVIDKYHPIYKRNVAQEIWVNKDSNEDRNSRAPRRSRDSSSRRL